LKIYGFSTQNNGCGLYRIWTPLDAIKRHGLAEVDREPDDPGSISIERADQIFRENDVIFCQPFSELWAASIFLAARDEHKKKIVLDLDDNIWAVHPMNVGPVQGKLTFLKSQFGGTFDDFWALESLDGKNIQTYQRRIDGTVVKRDDGKAFFLKNKRADVKLAVEMMLQHADAVTTTNEVLANVIREHTDKPVYVLPNCLDLSTWKKASVPEDQKWIGWFGSVSHYPDVKPVVPALDNLMKKHPDLNIQIMGSSFDYLFPVKDSCKKLPVSGYGPTDEMYYTDLENSGERWPGRMRFDRPVPVQEFNSWLSSNWQGQIGLAPIESNDFNDSKSELKWLEYTAMGIPVVASNFGPYKRAITSGVDGFLVNGPDWWEIVVDELLKNRPLREKLVTSARGKLEKHYDINSQCQKWLEVFYSVSQSLAVA
jgi:glycosyltransferase involved in cell wall biosynthesis